MEKDKAPRKNLRDRLLPGAKQHVIEKKITIGRSINSKRRGKKYSKQRLLRITDGYDMLQNFFVVKYYMCRKYKCNFKLFEILFYLGSEENQYFTGHDFYAMPKWFSYNRVDILIELGMVVMVSKHKTKKGSLYSLSPKAKGMVALFYEYLSGEKKIPEFNNPFKIKSAGIDSLRFELIKKMNAAGPSEKNKKLFE